MSAIIKKNSNLDAAIGSRLKAIRTSQGISQEVLGENIGVSFQQIQKYENGSNRLSLSRALKVSNFLNVEINELVPELDENSAINRVFHDKETLQLVDLWLKIKDPEVKKSVMRILSSVEELESTS